MASNDRDVLLVLYRSANGPYWANKTKWGSDAHLSEWHGVEVNAQDRVVRLALGNNNLRGTYSPVQCLRPALVCTCTNDITFCLCAPSLSFPKQSLAEGGPSFDDNAPESNRNPQRFLSGVQQYRHAQNRRSAPAFLMLGSRSRTALLKAIEGAQCVAQSEHYFHLEKSQPHFLVGSFLVILLLLLLLLLCTAPRSARDVRRSIRCEHVVLQ